MNRREFTAAGGAAVLAACLEPALGSRAQAAAALKWPHYRNTISIDALGGLGRMGGSGGPPFNEVELADARESGLTGLRLSLAPQGKFWFNDAAFHHTLDVISEWDRQIIARPDVFSLILKDGDLARAQRERKVGIIYGFQETSPLGEDLDRIELFRKRGVRVIQLTHNRRNLVGDGCMEPGNAGLSNYGHEMIEALEQHRVVVDLSHAGRRTTSEAIAASKQPLLIGHTGCAALSDLPRCVTDESLRAMAGKGGVAGIIFWPYLRKDTQPIAALAANASLAAQPPASPKWQQLVGMFDPTLEKAGIVGGSVALVEDGRIAARHNYGYADKATGSKVDNDTIFHWASITKTLNAIAMMQLRDRGRLKLEDPVTRLVPELRQMHNPYGSMDAITIRMLLDHSAGFQGGTWPYKQGAAWEPFEPTRWDQLVSMMPYQQVEFVPGTRFSYSNPAWIYAARTLELLTGDQWQYYIQKNIFSPLGMSRSYFSYTPDYLRAHRSKRYIVEADAAGKQTAVDHGGEFDPGITIPNAAGTRRLKTWRRTSRS